MQPSRYSLLSAASEEADVCKERTFTVVDQQGEFVQSQGAVGRDAEQREELPGACNTKQANMSAHTALDALLHTGEHCVH